MSPSAVRPEVERSLALHREVAERLRRDPELLVAARERVERWLTEGSVDATWAEAWRSILDAGVETVIEVLTDTDPAAHDVAEREKDIRFVRAAIAHGIVDREVLPDRLESTPAPDERRQRIHAFIAKDFGD